ncbi:MAG: sulfite exporter TauE/SafE family protein [Chitinophagaceae bacterium]
MLAPAIIAGITLGVTGSLHCIGMCGPLSLALPTHHLSTLKKFLSLLFYQFGRIVTYSLFGVAIGFAGTRIFIAGYQQLLSILLGALILLFALLYFLQKKTIHVPFMKPVYSSVQKLIIQLMRKAKNPFGFLLMGMANGLLPCGMVYIAMAATLAFTNLWESTLFMAMFGIGTLPAMMLVSFAGRLLTFHSRQQIQKIIPAFIAVTGIILILRGLDLGIPFISPVLPQQASNVANCHP